MQQFLAGVVVVLLAVVPVAVLMLRKKIYEVRKSQQEHLREFEELWKLTGGLAHEIKNPLSTIKVNLDLIDEDLETSNPCGPSIETDQRYVRARRKIGVVKNEAGRLEHILEGFLHYLDRTQLQPAAVNINELVSDMIDFYSPQCQSNRITLRHGLCSEALVCKVDPGMLKQVILNLFINAQQAMSNGGELIIKTDRQKNNAVIQISDTGSGIASERLPKLFDAYHSSRCRGSGLGLPIAKKIIKAHNGTITVDSEQGKGTSFTIKLPMQV